MKEIDTTAFVSLGNDSDGNKIAITSITKVATKAKVVKAFKDSGTTIGMIGWCRVGGAFGNMKDPKNIKWPRKPTMCTKSMCHCNFDIMSKKVLPADCYEVLEDAD